jgi:hypothetical protein
MSELYFETISYLNKRIRITKAHWGLITKIKHPEIEHREVEVKSCLAHPVEIRQSLEAEGIYLYYQREGKYYLCVVVRHLNDDGFIITAYITNKIKEGKVVWKR